MPRVVVIGLVTTPVHPDTNGNQLAEPALIHRAPQEAHRRIVAVLFDFSANQSAFTGNPRQLLGMLKPQGYRLFDNHVDAGLKRLLRMLIVIARLGQDAEEVGFFRKQRIHVGNHRAAANIAGEGFRLGPVEIRNRHDIGDVRQFVPEHFPITRRNPAASQNPDPSPIRPARFHPHHTPLTAFQAPHA